MENKPSVEGIEHRKRLKILELHLGSEYYRTGEFHNNISNAMQEYASLLVAAKEKEIEGLKKQQEEIWIAFGNFCESVTKLKK